MSIKLAPSGANGNASDAQHDGGTLAQHVSARPEGAAAQHVADCPSVEDVTAEADVLCWSEPSVGWLDALSLSAGPTRALVFDDDELVGVVPWDVERGAPIESVPAIGMVP